MRERKLLSLPEAVRKMSSLPARKFNLKDRGLVAIGAKADLMLFEPETVGERTTYETPRQFPVGIRAVIVNGHIALRNGSISIKRAGQALRGE